MTIPNTRTIALLTAVALAAACLSCATVPLGVTASTTPLGDKIISERLGQVEGRDSAWSLFGLWMFGKPDIDDAIADALARKGGAALVDVRLYERTAFYLLFSVSTVIVRGEAVALSDAPADAGRKR